MSEKFPPTKSNRNTLLLFVISFVLFVSGCAVEAAKSVDKKLAEKNVATAVSSTENSSEKNTITVQKDSPADTVRVFYKNLREKRFRDALFLTNLRPAVEGLTDAELKDLQVDFEPLAAQVPAEIEINGEIISKNKAVVTAKLPDNETGEVKLQEIKLRDENGVWVILTVDEAAETLIKKEGKNYFFALKIETYQEEAKKTLGQIAKAQFVYAAQNGGIYADMPTLINKGLVSDALAADLAGYNFKVLLSSGKNKYTATAEPAVYGKTGKLSFRFEVDGKKSPILKSADNKGKLYKD